MGEHQESGDNVALRTLEVSVYRIPTAEPESDGTIAWNSTTMVVVTVAAGGTQGIGYTYADACAATLISGTLKEAAVGMNVMDVEAIRDRLIAAVRNNGQCGIAMMAISAVDIALWDLKARLLRQSLSVLLGKVRDRVPVYGSGGFTSQSDKELRDQLGGWAEQGFDSVKMKVGRRPDDDVGRVRAAREAIGSNVSLFVDANGALQYGEALRFAEDIASLGVTWFEEPVAYRDVEGLARVRHRLPRGMSLAAGEYGYMMDDFSRLIGRGAVDILQADATRCGGISGFIQAGRLAESMHVPFSSHCAPSVHVHAAASLNKFFIAEYFADHAQIEELFFEGFCKPRDGAMIPDLSRPGLGLTLKKADAAKYQL